MYRRVSAWPELLQGGCREEEWVGGVAGAQEEESGLQRGWQVWAAARWTQQQTMAWCN